MHVGKFNMKDQVKVSYSKWAGAANSGGEGVWINNESVGNLNDVHAYVRKDGEKVSPVIVLGHNNEELDRLGGTPLALVFGDNIEMQHKIDEKNVGWINVKPEVVYKHFLAFLHAVRNETLANPIEVN